MGARTRTNARHIRDLRAGSVATLTRPALRAVPGTGTQEFLTICVKEQSQTSEMGPIAGLIPVGQQFQTFHGAGARGAPPWMPHPARPTRAAHAATAPFPGPGRKTFGRSTQNSNLTHCKWAQSRVYTTMAAI